MAGSIKGIIVEIGGDTSGLQKALSKVNSATASLSKELRGINSLLKLDPKNTTLLAQKQTVLKENIEKTSEKLHQLTSVQDQAYEKWQNYLKVEPQLKKVTEAVDKTKTQLDELKESQKKAKEEFDKNSKAKEQYEKIGEKIKQCSSKLIDLKKKQQEAQEKFEKGKIGQEQYEKITDRVKKCTTELSNLQNQQKELQGTFTNIDKAKQKYEEITKKVEDCTTELKKIEDLQSQLSENTISTENYRAYQREIEKTRQELAKLKAENSNWTKIGNSLVEFGTNLTNLSSKIENVGNNITQKLTLPILALSSAIGTAMINSAMEFESAWTGVTKTVDGTEEQMEKLKQGIKDMAEELPSSTTEISAVAEAAGQLGIETDNVLEFTKTMINMGNATNLSADEAATTLARFANVTRMSQSDFGRLGSVIVALGNNFATTESEIAQMGMNLASAGTQVGMTQPQIMALATALSSVGLESQAGGTAFSKVMVNMQLAVEKGGKGLKDFAKVAGMTTKEFKEAFKKDATSAIMAFVEGLSKSGERGKSAIKILDDMEIKETRLRDALLRSANASDVMRKAINLGNKAWNENTALSEEANKRYQTLASKVEMTKNKLINLATKMGDKLTPTASKLLDKVDDLIDKFDDLSDEEALNIVKTVAMVAAIGPAITAIGKLGTTTGKTIVTIGNFSKAIGNVKNGVKVAEGQVGIFTKLLTNLPVALAIAAVGAYTVALLELTVKEKELNEEVKNAEEAVTKQKESWDNLSKAREEFINANSGEIVELQNLRNELSRITDENGKVKSGYEDRANFIITKLKEATGQEIQMNDGVIQSYQEVQKAVDDTLKKKQAEQLLSAYQAEYTEALKNRSKEIQGLATLQEEVNKKLERQREIEEKIKNQKIPSDVLLQQYSNLSDEIDELNGKIDEANDNISHTGYIISNYTDLEVATVDGGAEAISNALNKINVSYEKNQESAEGSYSQQIIYAGKYVSTLKELLKDAKNAGDTYRENEIKNELDSQQTKLKNLEKSLKDEIYTINTLGEEQIEAFKYIADNDRTGYMDILNNLDPDTQALLQDVTDSISSNMKLPNAMKDLGKRGKEDYKNEIDNISNDTDAEIKATAATVNNYKGVEIASENMAINATNAFDNNNNLAQKMREEVNATANVENSDTSVGSGALRLANEVNTNFNNNVDGHTWGSHLTSNIASGILSKLPSITSAASKVAGVIASYLHHTVPDEGPLTDEMEYMPDMIDNLTRTLLQASPKLENATLDLAQKMAENLSLNGLESGISPNVISSTKTIFTTPQIVFNVQELDEGKLQQCFNYVNRKFGSKY